MKRVNDWSTTRSGATMTVVGSEMDPGQSVRLTGVDWIGAMGRKIVAIRSRETVAELLP